MMQVKGIKQFNPLQLILIFKMIRIEATLLKVAQVILYGITNVGNNQSPKHRRSIDIYSSLDKNNSGAIKDRAKTASKKDDWGV